MGQEELMNKITELEREIAILPEGSITKEEAKIEEEEQLEIVVNLCKELCYLEDFPCSDILDIIMLCFGKKIQVRCGK